MHPNLKNRQNANRRNIADCYEILGFISSGTYGNVFKAIRKPFYVAEKKDDTNREFAIKQLKSPDSGANQSLITQSAYREIMTCKEICHTNLVALVDVFIDVAEWSISMVFEYAEHDLLQILHYHSHIQQRIPEVTIKSIIFQLLNGLDYLHQNWIMHRDMKPANILVSSSGIVKIADLGLARLCHCPLQSFYQSDKVVVTIWYRSMELLVGARHYSFSIDLWATGCILAELILLRPLFKGEEAKGPKNTVPFQKDQIEKIVDVLGPPEEKWPLIKNLPDFQRIQNIKGSDTLRKLFINVGYRSENGIRLISAMLHYDPVKRISAKDALSHAYFSEEPLPRTSKIEYPRRKITKDCANKI